VDNFRDLVGAVVVGTGQFLVSSYTLGGYIHLLLVIAIVVLLIRIIQGRRPI
jgi:hypothetical protein